MRNTRKTSANILAILLITILLVGTICTWLIGAKIVKTELAITATRVKYSFDKLSKIGYQMQLDVYMKSRDHIIRWFSNLNGDLQAYIALFLMVLCPYIGYLWIKFIKIVFKTNKKNVKKKFIV